MGTSVKDRIEWYVSRIKVADDALKREIPFLDQEAMTCERLRIASQIACTDGIVDELESVVSSLKKLEKA